VRILIVDTCYPAFLEAHYERAHGLDEREYTVQWRSLMDTFFGTADSYSHFLAQNGHVAHELVVNCEPVQSAWAREHKRRLRGRSFGRTRRPRTGDVVLAQAEEFGPDVVYAQNLSALPVDVLRQLRARSRLLVGQVASELPEREQLEPFDLILTSFPHYVARLRALGIASEYFRIGFDPRILDRLGAPVLSRDAVFVGSLGRGQHPRGNDLLERAARRVPIEFWGPGAEEWPDDSPIKTGHRGEAWGMEMFRVLAESRVAINRHIDVAEDFANNMRLYEATGVGTLLITDAKRNLADLFQPGVEIETYADDSELAEKVAYYLNHEDERARIAAAGQRRTLADHTYARRMAELETILARYLS